MSNFQPLEVVDRGSETQLQVVENLNKLTRQDKNIETPVLSIVFVLTEAEISSRGVEGESPPAAGAGAT